MSDKRIIELNERSTLVNNDYIATDNTNGTAKVNGAILQQKKDSASLALYGSTNTSGSTISSGTYFYLNGSLVKALANIAANASFTLNTNYKVVSIGEELSQLNNDLKANTFDNLVEISNPTSEYTAPSDGYYRGLLYTSATNNDYVTIIINEVTLARIFGHSGGAPSYCVFVRKGMKCKIAASNINVAAAAFCPIHQS